MRQRRSTEVNRGFTARKCCEPPAGVSPPHHIPRAGGAALSRRRYAPPLGGQGGYTRATPEPEGESPRGTKAAGASSRRESGSKLPRSICPYALFMLLCEKLSCNGDAAGARCRIILRFAVQSLEKRQLCTAGVVTDALPLIYCHFAYIHRFSLFIRILILS